MRRRLYITGAAVLALALSFVAGRYSAPRRVETRTEWKERVVERVAWKDRVVVQRGPERIRTVTREIPGGERVVERVVERGPVTTTRDLTGTASATTDQASASSTVSETGRPGWSVGAVATWDPGRLSSMPARLGLEVDRRILGRVWLGARASIGSLTDPKPQIGAALRMEF